MQKYTLLQLSHEETTDLLGTELAKLQPFAGLFPTVLEKTKEYAPQWRTLGVRGSPSKISIFRKMDKTPLMEFVRRNDRYYLSCDGEESPSTNKRYVFGREPTDKIGGNLYYVSVPSKGNANKKTTNIRVMTSISRIHIYVKNENDKSFLIANVGITELEIRVDDEILYI